MVAPRRSKKMLSTQVEYYWMWKIAPTHRGLCWNNLYPLFLSLRMRFTVGGIAVENCIRHKVNNFLTYKEATGNMRQRQRRGRRNSEQLYLPPNINSLVHSVAYPKSFEPFLWWKRARRKMARLMAHQSQRPAVKQRCSSSLSCPVFSVSSPNWKVVGRWPASRLRYRFVREWLRKVTTFFPKISPQIFCNLDSWTHSEEISKSMRVLCRTI